MIPKKYRSIPGISEMTVTYEPRVPFHQRIQICKSKDIFDYLKVIWPETLYIQETFMIIYLDRRNRIISSSTISFGGQNGTIVDSRVIFRNTLLANSSSVILAHNHPSGDVRPSENDIRLTRKIKEGALILDISVLDHIIIGENNYLSFADEGLL